MNSFETNGGYIVKKETNHYGGKNIRYMDCKHCGGQVRNVGEEAKSVICNTCFNGRMVKQFPETADFNGRTNKPTGRPAGWHWMSEFVDKDGNVFHKGKEMKKLKGTLKPTKVKPPTKRIKRRTKDAILVEKYNAKKKAEKEKKKALKKAVKKQQDFINHNIDKG
jgi:hypothetical protein